MPNSEKIDADFLILGCDFTFNELSSVNYESVRAGTDEFVSVRDRLRLVRSFYWSFVNLRILE